MKWIEEAGAEGQNVICEKKDGEKIEIPFDYMLVAMGTKSVNNLKEIKRVNINKIKSYMI
jgi:hypothetical protein